jgi:hypothetical protein
LQGVGLTILNSMAGPDFEQALDRHLEWNLKVLDLKDAVFGKGVADLSEGEAARAAALIERRGLSVFCLSTLLFEGVVEDGEEAFRSKHAAGLSRAIAVARALRPRLVRLLTPRSRRRSEFPNCVEYVRREHRWLFAAYAEAIDMLWQAGFRATIENEVGGCILAGPAEVRDFFGELGCGEKAVFTWDVQNMWQEGTFPTPEVYRELKPFIGYYHVKGGQRGERGKALRWQSGLEDASWPVVEITSRVVADGVAPVICLNPPHGKARPGYDYANLTDRDLGFLRSRIPGVE